MKFVDASFNPSTSAGTTFDYNLACGICNGLSLHHASFCTDSVQRQQHTSQMDQHGLNLTPAQLQAVQQLYAQATGVGADGNPQLSIGSSAKSPHVTHPRANTAVAAQVHRAPPAAPDMPPSPQRRGGADPSGGVPPSHPQATPSNIQLNNIHGGFGTVTHAHPAVVSAPEARAAELRRAQILAMSPPSAGATPGTAFASSDAAAFASAAAQVDEIASLRRQLQVESDRRNTAEQDLAETLRSLAVARDAIQGSNAGSVQKQVRVHSASLEALSNPQMQLISPAALSSAFALDPCLLEHIAAGVPLLRLFPLEVLRELLRQSSRTYLPPRSLLSSGPSAPSALSVILDGYAVQQEALDSITASQYEPVTQHASQAVPALQWGPASAAAVLLPGHAYGGNGIWSDGRSQAGGAGGVTSHLDGWVTPGGLHALVIPAELISQYLQSAAMAAGQWQWGDFSAGPGAAPAQPKPEHAVVLQTSRKAATLLALAASLMGTAPLAMPAAASGGASSPQGGVLSDRLRLAMQEATMQAVLNGQPRPTSGHAKLLRDLQRLPRSVTAPSPLLASLLLAGAGGGGTSPLRQLELQVAAAARWWGVRAAAFLEVDSQYSLIIQKLLVSGASPSSRAPVPLTGRRAGLLSAALAGAQYTNAFVSAGAAATVTGGAVGSAEVGGAFEDGLMESQDAARSATVPSALAAGCLTPVGRLRGHGRSVALQGLVAQVAATGSLVTVSHPSRSPEFDVDVEAKVLPVLAVAVNVAYVPVFVTLPAHLFATDDSQHVSPHDEEAVGALDAADALLNAARDGISGMAEESVPPRVHTRRVLAGVLVLVDKGCFPCVGVAATAQSAMAADALRARGVLPAGAGDNARHGAPGSDVGFIHPFTSSDEEALVTLARRLGESVSSYVLQAREVGARAAGVGVFSTATHAAESPWGSDAFEHDIGADMGTAHSLGSTMESIPRNAGAGQEPDELMPGDSASQIGDDESTSDARTVPSRYGLAHAPTRFGGQAAASTLLPLHAFRPVRPQHAITTPLAWRAVTLQLDRGTVACLPAAVASATRGKPSYAGGSAQSGAGGVFTSVRGVVGYPNTSIAPASRSSSAFLPTGSMQFGSHTAAGQAVWDSGAIVQSLPPGGWEGTWSPQHGAAAAAGWRSANVRVCDVPRGTYLLLAVVASLDTDADTAAGDDSDDDEGVDGGGAVVGWAAVPLFTAEGGGLVMATGRQRVPVWAGDAPLPTASWAVQRPSGRSDPTPWEVLTALDGMQGAHGVAGASCVGHLCVELWPCDSPPRAVGTALPAATAATSLHGSAGTGRASGLDDDGVRHIAESAVRGTLGAGWCSSNVSPLVLCAHAGAGEGAFRSVCAESRVPAFMLAPPLAGAERAHLDATAASLAARRGGLLASAGGMSASLAGEALGAHHNLAQYAVGDPLGRARPGAFVFPAPPMRSLIAAVNGNIVDAAFVSALLKAVRAGPDTDAARSNTAAGTPARTTAGGSTAAFFAPAAIPGAFVPYAPAAGDGFEGDHSVASGLTQAQAMLVWVCRGELAGTPEAIPLLLRAAALVAASPYSTPAAAHAASQVSALTAGQSLTPAIAYLPASHKPSYLSTAVAASVSPSLAPQAVHAECIALLQAHSPLPLHIAVTLLCDTAVPRHVDFESAAVASLAATPAHELLPFAVPLCLAACTNHAHAHNPMDTPLVLWLLATAAAHPNTLAWHLVWALQSLAAAHAAQRPAWSRAATGLLQLMLQSFSADHTAAVADNTAGVSSLVMALTAAVQQLGPLPGGVRDSMGNVAVGGDRSAVQRVRMAMNNTAMPSRTRLPLIPPPLHTPAAWYRRTATVALTSAALSLGSASAVKALVPAGGSLGAGALADRAEALQVLGDSDAEEEEDALEAEEAALALVWSGRRNAAHDSVLAKLDTALAPLGIFSAESVLDGAVEQYAAEIAPGTVGVVSGGGMVHCGECIPSVGLPQGGLSVEAVDLDSTAHAVAPVRQASSVAPGVAVGLRVAHALSASGQGGGHTVVTGDVPRPLLAAGNVWRLAADVDAGLRGVRAPSLVAGPRALLAAGNAVLANALTSIWRRAGLPVGDLTVPYAHVLLPASVRPASSAQGHHSEGSPGHCGAPLTLVGGVLLASRSRPLSAILGVSHSDVHGAAQGKQLPGQPPSHGALQRWLMAQLLSAATGGGANGGGDADSDEEDALAASGSGAYDAIVGNFVGSLVGAVVTAFVLGLSPRAPGQLALAPSGHVSLLSLHGASEALIVDEAPLLHCPVAPQSGATHSGDGSRFASARLCEQLLLVTGQAPWLDSLGRRVHTAQLCTHSMRLLTMARAALMALRSAAGELCAVRGAWLQATGLPKAHVGAQIAALRSRLCLHLDDHAAREALTSRIMRTLQLQ